MAFAALRAAMLSRCTRSLSVLGRISLILGAARSQAQVQASHLHCSAPAMATMNAIRVKQFGGPEALEVVETPVPAAEDNTVLVRIAYVGINPVETYIREGQYAALPSLPFTPGKEAAGTVHAVGKGVDPAMVGKKVYLTDTISGAYAPFSLCSAKDVRVVPEGVSLADAAAVPIAYRTAYRALFQKASPRPGDVILVHGASGAVGLAAVQLATARGIKVIGTASSDEGREAVMKSGALSVYNHRTEGYDKQISADWPHIALIVEMLANVNLDRDMDLIGKNGVIAVVGNRGEIQVNPRKLMLKEAQVIGVLGGTESEWDEAYTAINQGLANGSLKPVIQKVYPMSEVSAAHEDVISRSGGSCGKILLKVE